MADFVVSDSSLKTIADAIRETGDTSSPLVFPDGFEFAIRAISAPAIGGTFRGVTTGMPLDIPLAYKGTGYPINVFIYPSEGTYNSSGAFYNVVQRYAMVYWAGLKNAIPSAPVYSGSDINDQMSCFMMFKNSTTNARIFDTTSVLQAATYQNIDAAASANYCVRLKNNKLMSVFIASTGYGFMANIDYNYIVIYSS